MPPTKKPKLIPPENNQLATTNDCFPFLKLVGELRNEVYGWYFTPDEKFLPFDEDYDPKDLLPKYRARFEMAKDEEKDGKESIKINTGAMMLRHYRPGRFPVALRKTNKQINKEVDLFLWTITNFDFTDGIRDSVWIHDGVFRLDCFFNVIKVPWLKKVKYLTIDEAIFEEILFQAKLREISLRQNTTADIFKVLTKLNLKRLTVMGMQRVTRGDLRLLRSISGLSFWAWLKLSLEFKGLDQLEYRVYPGFSPSPRYRNPEKYLGWHGLPSNAAPKPQRRYHLHEFMRKDDITRSFDDRNRTAWARFAEDIANRAEKAARGRNQVNGFPYSLRFGCIYECAGLWWSRCLMLDYKNGKGLEMLHDLPEDPESKKPA